jgi:thiosulfate dehydrogenase
MGRFLLGVIIGILLLAGCGYYYFTSGTAPVAATAQPMPFERYFAGRALHARLSNEAPKTVPIQATPDNLLAGAQIYKQNCAFCHGLPNAQASPEGRGMFPHAPQLFTRRGMVTDDPPGVTFWKVSNGIRLSGMPSFQSELTEQQMWQVALMLRNADKLPADASAALAPAPATPAPAAAPAKPMTMPMGKGKK